ncbi:hypothetical protein GYMLUDRAFT_53817 [Collybiopsis luxurians FD-317 M1]|nr:hypothetical protein GYMLUDRAFT_53817 [Collybiopsis luxurians FD-317 M1]
MPSSTYGSEHGSHDSQHDSDQHGRNQCLSVPTTGVGTTGPYSSGWPQPSPPDSSWQHASCPSGNINNNNTPNNPISPSQISDAPPPTGQPAEIYESTSIPSKDSSNSQGQQLSPLNSPTNLDSNFQRISDNIASGNGTGFDQVDKKYERYFDVIKNILLTKAEKEHAYKAAQDAYEATGKAKEQRDMLQIERNNGFWFQDHWYVATEAIKNGEWDFLITEHSHNSIFHKEHWYIPILSNVPVELVNLSTPTTNQVPSEPACKISDNHPPQATGTGSALPVLLNLSDQPTTSPLHEPTMIKGQDENGLMIVWKDHVTVQQQQNANLKEQGNSKFPDQVVGFNKDSLPIEKNTVLCKHWTYKVPVHAVAVTTTDLSTINKNAIHSDTNTLKYSQTDEIDITRLMMPNSGAVILNDSGSKAIKTHSWETPKVATGGPPNDPEGDGNSSNLSNGEGKGNCSFNWGQTPWDDDSTDILTKTNSTESSTDDSWADNLFGAPEDNKDDEVTKTQCQKKWRKAIKKLQEETADDECRKHWSHAVHCVYKKKI